MQDKHPEPKREHAPVLVFGFLGRAYRLSTAGRRIVVFGDLILGLVIIGSLVIARLDFISLEAFAAILVAVFVFRFAVYKLYLILAQEPADDMPMSQRALTSFHSLPPQLVKGLVRTLTIASGVGFIFFSTMIVVHQNFTSTGWIVIGVLIIILAFALWLEIFVARMTRK
jgi:hypothetical protein